MSARDKSDFGSGKILPEELDAATHDDATAGGDVHPERDWATGPDLAAAEQHAATDDPPVLDAADAAADDGTDGDTDGAASDDAGAVQRGRGEHAPVESGAHFGGAPDPDAEPVELDHRPRHGTDEAPAQD